MRELVRDGGLAAEMGRRGLAAAEKNYTWNNAEEKLLEMYREVTD